MRWKRISKYAQRAGEWTVAAVMIRGEWTFEAWKGRELQAERMAVFPTAEEARAHASTLASQLASAPSSPTGRSGRPSTQPARAA